MATRDRTKTFLTFRSASNARRSSVHGGSGGGDGGGPMMGGGAKSGLLANDSLADAEAGEAGSAAGLASSGTAALPSWTRYVDQVRGDLAQIGGLQQKLASLHETHLRVEDFDEDEAQNEQAIEVCSREISRLFQRAQNTVVGLNKLRVATQSEQLLKANAAKELAAELQDSSGKFRKAQKEYLSRLQSLAARSRDMWGFGDGDGEHGDAGLSDFTDQGFDGRQLASATAKRRFVDQREKEIVSIAQSIEELASLFKDLSYLVVEQGSLLDRIDYNIEQTSLNVEKAVSELSHANKSHKKYRAKLIIAMLCTVILIVLIVMLVKKK